MSAGLVPYDEIKTFIDDGWIAELLFPMRSGKEATVYCCTAGPRAGPAGEGFYALKVYHPPEQRSFKNAAIYQEGRVAGDARETRAVKAKSRFGRAVAFGGWLHHEYALLGLLHAAGAAVPRPVAVAGNAMLMEFIGEAGRPAPQLSTLRLTRALAEALLEQALRTIELMLACHVVHGDLSAYNMLYARGRLRVIDLPQAVDARTNASAPALLARDVANVCGYFAGQGADAEPGTFAEELWELYARAEL